MGLVHHQAEHFGILLGFFRFLRKQFCNAVADFDRPLVQRLHTTRKQIGTVNNHFVNFFGVLQSKGQGDISPIGKAKQNGLFHPFFIHEIMQVLRKLLYGERFLSSR